MKKTIKHNIKDNKSTKKRSRNSNWEEHVADTLEQWALKDDSMIIEDFYTSLIIPEQTYYDAVRRNPRLKEANDFAVIRCGVNREKHAIKHNQSMNSLIAFSMPSYLKRWKEQIEWRSQLAKDQNQSLTKDNLREVMQEFNPNLDDKSNK